MDAKVVLPEYALIIMGYLLLPVAVLAAFESRKRLAVICPRDGKDAQVRQSGLKLFQATFTGCAKRVNGCSLWPDRAGCDRACEGAL